jgi:hypothetical protein
MRRLTTAQRRALYEAELADAVEDGAEYPACNICGGPIFSTDGWDVSHMPVAAALGGTRTGIAHRRCNREHGAKVVTPAVAQAKRRRDRHLGIKRSRHPFTGWRGFDGRAIRNPRG